MKADWDKYFIGLNESTNRLFIGKGFLSKDGIIKFKSKSDDKTFEIVNAVGNMMKRKMNNKKANKSKHYFGYNLPCGKLILVEDGYNFDVYKDNSVCN